MPQCFLFHVGSLALWLLALPLSAQTADPATTQKLQVGVAAYQNGQMTLAETDLRAAVRLSPSSADAHSALGIVL